MTEPTRTNDAPPLASTDSSSSPLSLSDEDLLSEPLLSKNEEDQTSNDGSSFVLLASDEYHPDTAPHVLDPQRFYVLAVFSLNNLLASACWITFAPVEDAVQRFYHNQITPNQVNWLSMIMMIAYGPASPLVAWAIPKLGLRTTVVASSCLISFGGLLRWYSALIPDSPHAYHLVLAGQAIVSIGQTVFCNAPARVASTWFQNTTQAISVVVFSGMIGMALAQAMSPLFVEQTTGKHLDQLLAGQAVAILACTIATYWWFRSQPPLPPSAAEAARRQQQQQQSTTQNITLKRDVWRLATDPQYQLLLIAFGIEYGVNNAVLTLLQPWIASSGYHGDKVAGLCGSLAIIGGVLGNMIAAPLLDASKNYNQAIRWSFAVAFFVSVATVMVLQYSAPVWLLATIFFVVGMSQLPLLTIVLDAAAAHSYPIPEELSSAGLQLVGQYLGVVLVDVMGYLISANTDGRKGFAAPVNISFLVFLGFSAAIALCYRGDDPRASVNAMRSADNDYVVTSTTVDVELAEEEEEEEQT